MVAPLVSAVMPCLNEEITLGICIRKAQQCFAALGIEGEVVIADNGSTDRSVEIARELGARVVHQSIKGYGAALTAGIEAAAGEIIVMADADDSYDWSGMGPFIEKIRAGYDLVVGNRFKGGIARGAMPPMHRYLGNPVLSTLARVVHRAPIGDFHCGLRAFTKAAFVRMHLRTPGMEFATEMVVSAARAGMRITEVPTTLKPDGRNRPPHLRSFRDGWRHLRFIFTYAPNYLYMAPGMTMLLVGAALVVLLARGPVMVGGHFLGIHFLALGSLLALTGFNVINLGVLAKAIAVSQLPTADSRIRRWALNQFTLESGLIVGVLLLLTGVGIDIYIFATWLHSARGPQEETVHTAFAATLMIVLGLNIIFSSFLLNMFMSDHRERLERKGP
ncbi:MAG: glycosyltransferase family 2 protein [Pseudomonadota bacterium]